MREATSNDQWGPSATLMAEIADLTYNTVAMAEIMKMIWKRLNDHGKNWRHVYKALVSTSLISCAIRPSLLLLPPNILNLQIVLEYLIRTGSERVAEQCKQNIFAIQTLNEFQYIEEGKDQGVNVREKAKLLVGLLRDDERLKNERAKALKARERFAQHPSAFGSDGSVEGPTQHMYGGGAGSSGIVTDDRRMPPPTEIEFMRPLTVGEEELQLQLAMAMSKEEAAQEEAKRRSDDVRLQLALSQSQQEFKEDSPLTPPQQQQQPQQQQSHLLDLLDINLGAMSVSGPSQGAGAVGGAGAGVDSWNIPSTNNAVANDPWGRTTSPPVDPWAPARSSSSAAAVDPWLGATGGSNSGPPAAVMNGRSNGSASDPWLGNNGAGSMAEHKNTNGSLLNQLNNNNGLGGAGGLDPWATTTSSNTNNNNMGLAAAAAVASDPWGPVALAQMGARPSPVGAITTPSGELDEFDIITNRTKSQMAASSNIGEWCLGMGWVYRISKYKPECKITNYSSR